MTHPEAERIALSSRRPEDVPAAASRPIPARTIALALAAFAALVLVRMPQILIKGRFWAEEGEHFFAYAWTAPASDALFTSFGGYWNLAASGGTVLARWLLPPGLAPYLTIAIGLACQLCPPLIVLAARDRWLAPSHIRVAGLAVLLLVPASEEIWLQTLHCQFELTLCCAMLLALDPADGRRRGWRYAVLVLAPLCGPTAIVLVPLFLIRAAFERDRARGLQGLALAVGSVVQLACFSHLAGRGAVLEPYALIVAVSLKNIAVPFLGVHAAERIAGSIREQTLAGHPPVVMLVLPFLVLLPFAAASIWSALRDRTRMGGARAAFWMLLACGIEMGTSYSGAIGGPLALIDVHLGGRYAFVPQALLGLATVALATAAGRVVPRLCALVLVWLILVAGTGYFRTWDLISDGPAWRPQLAAWRGDPSKALRIWPDGWVISLPIPRHPVQE